jgi:hypothetical protein
MSSKVVTGLFGWVIVETFERLDVKPDFEADSTAWGNPLAPPDLSCNSDDVSTLKRQSRHALIKVERLPRGGRHRRGE